MSETLEPGHLDGIGGRKVTVEVGVGHGPGRAVLDRLDDVSAVENGSIVHVSIDEVSSNLLHVSHGAVANMTLHDFAKNEYLDGAVSRMYLFNVFGEPMSDAVSAEIDEELFLGLKRKLSADGQIIIGEHITPKVAAQLKDTSRLVKLGFSVELYDKSSIAIEAKLRQLGFSKLYAASFIGQSEDNKSLRGPDHAGFLLLLRKRSAGSGQTITWPLTWTEENSS